MMIAIIIIFMISAILPLVLKNDKQVRYGSVVSAVIASIVVYGSALGVLFSISPSWSSNWWSLDTFSALMVSLVMFVYLAAVLVSSRYIGHEYHENIISLSQVRMYFSLVHLFVLCMVLAVLSNNTMIVWLAMESTTLSSTFLVGLYKKRTSIEAAWKYIILCSTGITLGLVGVLLLNYASFLAAAGQNVFMLTSLAINAKMFSPELVKWAFVFIFIGFGTKVGLVPMHTWLPDAHSKAPSPISALFSGILLNVALYVMMRFKFITDGALGGSVWTNGFFLIFGIMSILLPALLMLIQTNYKRMLAYSSIEHMGLISVAISLPPLGLVAAFIHMIGHTITKSLLFFGAGEFLLKWKTTKIESIKGLMKYAPYSGTFFLLGILAIIATPPSILFVSEYMLFAQMFLSHWILSLVVLGALSLIAFAMLSLTFSLLYGKGDEGNMQKEKWNITHSVMAVQFILIVTLAFVMTSPPGLTFIGSIVKTIK